MKSFRILFAILFTAQFAQAQFHFFPDDMVVTATSLNMRELPDKNGKKITSLPRGTVVRFQEAHNNGQWVQADTTDPNSPYGPWLKVQAQGKTGWVFGAHVTGTIGLYHEGDWMFSQDPLPPFHWYGIYRRDSFADEIRKIDVRLVSEKNELYGEDMSVLRTNQPDASKYIIGSLQPLRTGYAGPLGVFDVRDMFLSGELAPGATLSIHPGGDIHANDTVVKPSYIFAATGCARMDDTEYMNVKVVDYKLTLLDYTSQPPARQDLTPWFRQEEGLNPLVRLSWFGDIDMDGKPDAIFDDCPFEMGCRDALFLSSKAKPGQYLQKVCEHFWPGD